MGQTLTPTQQALKLSPRVDHDYAEEQNLNASNSFLESARTND